MNVDRIIRIKELMAIVGLSRSTIYKLMNEDKFPKQIHLSERTAGWRMSTVMEWINERENWKGLSFP
jgi:prophage regulatory protein